MKKILWLSVVFSLLFVRHSFAALSLTATATGNTINASLSGVTNNDTYKLIVQTTSVPTSGTYTGSPIVATTPLVDPTIGALSQSNGALVSPAITWTVSGYTAHTNYSIGVVEQPTDALKKAFYLPVSATVQTQDAAIAFLPLTTQLSGNNIIISGKIDTTKIGNLSPAGFTATLQYTTDVPQTGATTLPNPQGPLTSLQKAAVGSPSGISDDGTYFWIINNLQPSTVYYIQQTVTDPAGNTKVDVIDHFNSDTGNVIAPGSAAETADLNTRSYTLLSKGFPGLTVLPDPDLCAQERAAGQTPQFCDFNDVLNYFMKLIIGICGVVLVFRLMFEGYQIMVSDVPFLKAKAKSGFLTALGGLILALSSYIILNTINPKLVNESVDVAQLSIGVDGDAETPTVYVSPNQMSTGIVCPGSGRSSVVAQVAKSFVGRVTYQYGAKSAVAQSDGNALLDCSAFANTVLKCSGFSAPNDYVDSGSADIFAKGQSINMASDFKIKGNDVYIAGTKLNPGDLVGWTQATSTYGHVILYIGNATFMDSHSSKTPGGAIGTFSATQIQSMYGKLITAVKRIPV